ncbi:MAG: hypothetical protein EU539_08500 [Promethearchaeota archaeon]|nr:MAG: hypothetical protein EU539_08500 [Candidatus Lokiarchaeota archaeon]
MVEILIITSTEDIASINIRNNLLNSKSWEFSELDFTWHDNALFKLDEIKLEKEKDFNPNVNKVYLGLTHDPLINLDNLRLEDTQINPDSLIFASRHRSKTSKPAFLVHTTGNWSREAKFGGEPRRLSHSSAFLIKSGFISLVEQHELSNLKKFSIDMEVTHHGPTDLEKPLIFIELGSSKKEWVIQEAGRVVAQAIINTVLNYLKLQHDETSKVGLGFGGTHYAPQFRKLSLKEDMAISFICPKYYIEDLDETMIAQMISNTREEVDYFIVDWKGTNSQEKRHLIPLLEEFEIPIKKSKDF